MNKKKNIAVTGATGAVGIKILEVLSDLDFPAGKIKLFSSERNADKLLDFKGRKIPTELLDQDSFRNTDIAFFSAGSEISRKYADIAVGSGAVVIDNSSAFRNNGDVPLVIPEINPEDAEFHKGIISNPNCTTAIMLTVLNKIYRTSRIRKIIASTYQSVSGAGSAGIRELESQTSPVSNGQKSENPVFQHNIAYNLIPHIDRFSDNGYTYEELKMYNETRKILHDNDISVSATCVRVPVKQVHSMAVTIITEDELSVDKIKDIIRSTPGAVLYDDPSQNKYPMPLVCEGKFECYAGRIRKDIAFKNGISLWICGDQLLKGAALNAVQIAELL